MIPFISPEYSINYLLKIFWQRKRLANTFLQKIHDVKEVKSIYIRKKQRFVLAQILLDLKWQNKKIAMPYYTCDSLKSAITASGNIAVFYEINEDLSIETESLKSICEQGIDAIIISDVYGTQIQVPDFAYENKILLIGDFAHHAQLRLEKTARKFDIVLYSSNYYKPMISSGVGLGLIFNDSLNLADSIEIEKNLITSLVSTIKLFIIKIILHSFVIKSIYRRSLRKKPEDIIVERKSINHKPSIMDLALLSTCTNTKTDEIEKRREIYRSYFSKLESCKLIPNYENKNICYATVVCDDLTNIAVIERLLTKGVLAGRTFSNSMTKNNSCKVTPKLANSVVNLPLISNKIDADRIAQIFIDTIEELRRELS